MYDYFHITIGLSHIQEFGNKLYHQSYINSIKKICGTLNHMQRTKVEDISLYTWALKPSATKIHYEDTVYNWKFGAPLLLVAAMLGSDSV